MNLTNSTGSKIEPVIGTLRIVSGRRLKDAAPCAMALSSPLRAARSRDGERLFILLDVTGPVSSHLYRELREVVTRAYWSSTGSVTAALRQAVTAANRHLFQANLYSAPSDRYHGGLICAVLRDEDLFVLRSGSAQSCFVHQGHLKSFSGTEDLAPLGMGQVADVRLHHTYVAPGDRLLLASSMLVDMMDDTGVARVLARVEVQEILDGLEQVGAGADFSALVARWPLPGEARPVESRAPTLRGTQDEVPGKRRTRWPFSRPEGSARSDLDEAPVTPVEPLGHTVEAYRPTQLEPLELEVEEEAPVEREYPLPSHEPLRLEPVRETGPSLGERVGDGVRAVGRGTVAAGGSLAGGVSTLFRRMLPDPKRKARRRARPSRSRAPRPIPKENRGVMVAAAIGIPIVLAVTVALAYRSFGAEARFRSLIEQAEEETTLAQAVGGSTELSRPHWEAALGYADAAAALRSDDQVALALQAQAQAALDLIDGIIRLEPILLKDFGLGTAPRQLVVHGRTIFVLDPAGGWLSQLTLNQTGDSIVEEGDISSLVKTDQQIGEGTVGSLVDFVWVDLAGGRQTSGLLVLEEDGALISYDPAWQIEGGAPQLQRSFLGIPPESPRAIDTYDGRLYVLDVAINQIRRYEPRGDTYPERPEHYFVVPPSRPLADVLDMAIDGYIYLLYDDGTVLKFLRGEPEDFDVRGLPGNLSQAVALAVDPNGNSGVVYVVDRGNNRVVALGPDGTFRAQFRADEAFDALEALVVDEAMRRMYVISGGRFYVASLP